MFTAGDDGNMTVKPFDDPGIGGPTQTDLQTLQMHEHLRPEAGPDFERDAAIGPELAFTARRITVKDQQFQQAPLFLG
jgi:hypothetical protein